MPEAKGESFSPDPESFFARQSAIIGTINNRKGGKIIFHITDEQLKPFLIEAYHTPLAEITAQKQVIVHIGRIYPVRDWHLFAKSKPAARREGFSSPTHSCS